MGFIGNHDIRLLQKFRAGRVLFGLRAWLLSSEAPDQLARAMRSADRARVAVRASLWRPTRYSAAARGRYRRHLAGGLLGRTVDAPQSPDPWRGLYRLALRGFRFWRGWSRVYSDRPTGRLASRKRDRRHLRLYRERPCQPGGNCSVHPALFRISASCDLVRSRWRARGIFSVASAESATARIGDISVLCRADKSPGRQRHHGLLVALSETDDPGGARRCGQDSELAGSH